MDAPTAASCRSSWRSLPPGDYSPTGRIDNMVKDLNGVQDLARSTGTAMPLTAACAEIHRFARFGRPGRSRQRGPDEVLRRPGNGRRPRLSASRSGLQNAGRTCIRPGRAALSQAHVAAALLVPIACDSFLFDSRCCRLPASPCQPPAFPACVISFHVRISRCPCESGRHQTIEWAIHDRRASCRHHA